ncbi:DUF1624 domain-containing protein [Acholeplasma vituli]|uniref:DUF1624 domain-containing protein n=1 Tax=Paracholeplasma vituli TaxID=69473 RepID=A0ABT2PV71_9MOLU|nr:DUF1624 domain-containing protein [Paracholeplasma vituli]MCU0104613.1 DUF1624 domain-containing protein [Paracholeplasma vituli]
MKRIQSIDLLRGLGVFFVIILHTAFYYFDGIYDVDMDNPSLIITLIGFLLMFAGLFAMLSGASYTLQFLHTKDQKQRIKHMGLSGALMMVIAYLYFIFTGPGIINFDTRSMDESLLVSLIRDGKFQTLTLERLFYVDSLVMIALNIWLLTLLFHLIKKWIYHEKAALYILVGATLFMGLSYIRIPLYNVYLDARDSNNYVLWVLLNYFVSKNNPIFPFFAFALFGVWVGLLINRKDDTHMRKWMIPVALFYIVIGVTGYILAPETMLERAIDPTWYFIMVIQIGLFLAMILGAYYLYDVKKRKLNPVSRFIQRFGVAGLTPFFFEQITSALIFGVITLFFDLKLDIPLAIIFGVIHVTLWGFVLKYWSTKGYKYSLEWGFSQMINRISVSSKLQALEGKDGIH